MNPTPSISTCNSALPEPRQNRLLRAAANTVLAAVLLVSLAACGSGNGDSDKAPGAKPNVLEQAGGHSKKAMQTNSAAIGALQRAQAAEQTRLEDAERRRREMEAQGI